MPVSQARYALSLGTAVQIVPPDNQPQHVTVHEADHSESTVVFLGGPSVGTANGLHIHAGSTMQFELNPMDELWAISGQGTPTVHVITINKAD